MMQWNSSSVSSNVQIGETAFGSCRLMERTHAGTVLPEACAYVLVDHVECQLLLDLSISNMHYYGDSCASFVFKPDDLLQSPAEFVAMRFTADYILSVYVNHELVRDNLSCALRCVMFDEIGSLPGDYVLWSDGVLRVPVALCRPRPATNLIRVRYVNRFDRRGDKQGSKALWLDDVRSRGSQLSVRSRINNTNGSSSRLFLLPESATAQYRITVRHSSADVVRCAGQIVPATAAEESALHPWLQWLVKSRRSNKTLLSVLGFHTKLAFLNFTLKPMWDHSCGGPSCYVVLPLFRLRL